MVRVYLRHAAALAICAACGALFIACRTTKRAEDETRVYSGRVMYGDTAHSDADFSRLATMHGASLTELVVVVEEYDTNTTDTTGAHPLKKKSTYQYNNRKEVEAQDSTSAHNTSLAARGLDAGVDESTSKHEERVREQTCVGWLVCFGTIIAACAVIYLQIKKYRKRF